MMDVLKVYDPQWPTLTNNDPAIDKPPRVYQLNSWWFMVIYHQGENGHPPSRMAKLSPHQPGSCIMSDFPVLFSSKIHTESVNVRAPLSVALTPWSTMASCIFLLICGSVDVLSWHMAFSSMFGNKLHCGNQGLRPGIACGCSHQHCLYGVI